MRREKHVAKATNLTANTTYHVRAYGKYGSKYYYGSDVSFKTNLAIIIPPNLPPLLPPSAPANLSATSVSASSIHLDWADQSDNEAGFKVFRKTKGGTYSVIEDLPADSTTYPDEGLKPATTYYYKVQAYNSIGESMSNETNSTTFESENSEPPATEQTVICLYIGKSEYYVNNKIMKMDTVPVIREGRTLLPIRYVAEPLGADIVWNGGERKATVTLDGCTTIELWIDNNTAKVSGIDTLIDPINPNVMPVIMPPGRTMLPLRFIVENLGCGVEWNAATQEVKITYPK